MKPCPPPEVHRRTRRNAALTLIEVVGVLAVLAILAGVVLTALTKQTDKLVSDQETATLRAFGDGLQRAILRQSSIPDATGWARTIGNEIGLDVFEVVTNARHQLRQFVIDPNFSIGGNPLPYQQTYTGSGSTNVPQYLRFMILSSIGSALPNNLEDTIKKNPGDFPAIWNTPDGSTPPGISFQGWRGKGEDLKIQRIDISGLFLHLVLSYAASTTDAFYSINGATNLNSLRNLSPIDSYFLQNSVLGLYSTNFNNLDSQQILVHDASFVYFRDGWRSTAAQDPPVTSPFFVGALDPGALAASFLVAGGASAQTQLTSFTNYMSAYATWANGGFKDSKAYDNAFDAFLSLSNAITITLPFGL